MVQPHAAAPLLVAFFAMLAVGIWLRATKRATPQNADLLNLLVTDVTMPALVIRAMAGQGIRGEAVVAVSIAWVALAACWFLGFFAAKALSGSRSVQGTLGLCAGFSNTGFLGVPLVIALYGATPGAASTAIMIDVFCTTLWLYTLGVAWAIRFGGQGAFDLRQALQVLVTPTAIALATVLMLNTLGIRLPEWAMTAVRYLGDATVPLVTLSLGIRLDFRSLSGRSIPIVVGACIKMLICPLVALLCVKATGLRGAVAEVTVLASAMPSAMMSAVVAARYGCDVSLGTGMVVFTTALTGVSAPLVLAGIMWVTR